jgi:hypothetical protein
MERKFKTEKDFEDNRLPFADSIGIGQASFGRQNSASPR